MRNLTAVQDVQVVSSSPQTFVPLRRLLQSDTKGVRMVTNIPCSSSTALQVINRLTQLYDQNDSDAVRRPMIA